MGSFLKNQDLCDHNVLKVVSIGRPHWKKGYVYALDALKLLKDLGISFQYTLIEGSGAIEFQYQVHDLELGDEVELLGKLSDNMVDEYFNNADVLLLTSLGECEFDMVLKAMAIETLVLSTNCNGINDLIINGENGFLVPIRNAQAIADTLVMIKNLPREQYNFITKTALKTIQRKF
ncbi:glycosyltransferase family 4 protein [Hanstruepera flava]|uniref:glycosyltransferase family 4 protein n=1 Tax=Hanstruepera flava TaxID=2930218 RepID=UPI002028820C|nr:glycosyltransferase [Hanstruepera flava]